MRRLVIVCGCRNVPAVKAGLARYGHPQAIADFISIVERDLDVEFDPQQLRREVYDALQASQAKTTGEPFVCVTHELSRALSRKTLEGMMSLQSEAVSAKALCALQASDGVPTIARLLNRCDLSLRNASAHYISQWDHHALGRQDVIAWLDQFSALGKLTWIGESILRNLQIIEANQLGQQFASIVAQEDGELCVNRDARRHGKSGDTIATLITKRSGKIVHESPATAIEDHGGRKIILFEDGLWTGTEAMGVIESLQGKRPGKEKTRALQDATSLADIDFTFAYGIATDFGSAVVTKFIENEGLQGRFKVVSGLKVPIASERLLADIQSGDVPLADIRRIGPPLAELRPYIGTQLGKDETLSDALRQKASEFCRAIGRQLFATYLENMQHSQGWDPWPADKITACGLGMHGLGMVHAFSHSVPKATLPLIWGAGDVEWEGRHVAWRPLLPNA